MPILHLHYFFLFRQVFIEWQMRTSNRRKLCFISVLEDQRLMYAVKSILIFLLVWATIALSKTTLVNAQTNSKVNIIVGSNNGHNPAITHGIASGDVTNHSAIIWSKSNKNATMGVLYDTNANMTNPQISQYYALVNQSADFTGHTKLESLRPDSVYYYQVQFSDPKNTNIVSQRSAIGS